MNTKNNKRRQATRKNIEAVFIELLQRKEISEITVSDICKRCEINRSTFYANYLDIYDLADCISAQLEQEVNRVYEENLANHDNIYLMLFRHIRDNQKFYLTYFKLGYDDRHKIDFVTLRRENKFVPDEHLEYHVEFHKAGLNALIKRWLAGGCTESPETMLAILQSEYSDRCFSPSFSFPLLSLHAEKP